ncbi:putative phage DNA-directed RNA polymerase beta subunit 2 [Salmonella phage SPFM7]|nr:putative phage DNA-directed RNA polymerase beta subunit 2 [Salmonella phage SPFM7]
MRIGTTIQEVMYGTNKTEDGQELDIIYRVEMAAADKMVIANQLKTTVRVEGVPLAYNSLCVRFYITRKTALALKRDEPKDGRVNGD